MFFRYSERIRDARYDDERIAYEREYLKKVDHRDSVNYLFLYIKL